MNKVVFDIDGVLADFEKAFCQKFGCQNRHLVSLEKRYPYLWEFTQLFVDMASTYENLDIVPIGFEMCKWCSEQGFEIHLVSSRPHYTLETTQRWLLRNKVPYDYLSVDKTPKQSRIIDIDPLFIVDDLLSVCVEAHNIGTPSFLIDWPWNQENSLPEKIHRIKDFQGFLREMEHFGEFHVKW